jgi:glucosamine--fructose-6-phosphate aminotransferase (isomerizing)
MEEQLKNSLMEQSDLAPDFIERMLPLVLDQARSVLQPWLEEVDEILICGCGDSHHAALGLELAFSLWSRRRVRAAPAMYASRYLVPQLGAGAARTLVIGISVSGEVARTIEAVELANEVGAKTLAFTSDPTSNLGKRAKGSLSVPVPVFEGPGLLSYLASLLMGYVSCVVLAGEGIGEIIFSAMQEFPMILDEWMPSELQAGLEFAENSEQITGCVFVAGGSLMGSAIFSAAKVIESSGLYAWAQEIEEWAHLEYFCDPADMPTWFLTSGGRTASREQELFAAAEKIGRRIHISHWEGKTEWDLNTREALAPLGIWVGPVAFAARIAEMMDESPFRGFCGGRSQLEGGGPSRIRSSSRINSIRDLRA